jgi:hypothetical protein
MGGHKNEEIKKTVERSEVLVGKLADLEKRTVADLKKGFQDMIGIPIPTAVQAELLKIDSVMQYTAELKIEDFLRGALTLALATFTGEDAEIATKAVVVATAGIKNIMGPKIVVGFKGDAARMNHGGERYVSALYAASQFCSGKDWLSQSDFYVANYCFTVFQPSKVALTRGALGDLSKIDALWEI